MAQAQEESMKTNPSDPLRAYAGAEYLLIQDRKANLATREK